MGGGEKRARTPQYLTIQKKSAPFVDHRSTPISAAVKVENSFEMQMTYVAN